MFTEANIKFAMAPLSGPTAGKEELTEACGPTEMQMVKTGKTPATLMTPTAPLIKDILVSPLLRAQAPFLDVVDRLTGGARWKTMR